MKTKRLTIFVCVVLLLITACHTGNREDSKPNLTNTDSANCWTGAGANQIPVDKNGELIRYGRTLIEKTAFYFGPKGSVAQISNGMNCQNCHIDAGTKPWGNNYGAVASTYPKFRDRSGSMESIEKRINDCFERSLNGQAIDSNSNEMRAMVAYINWLGADISKGTKPRGSGIMDLPQMARAADPAEGQKVYVTICEKCHGKNGEGQINPDQITYLYPPLWGKNSYTNGAGLYRLSRFAGFVKNNMPNPTNYHHPQLTDEQAWDVAAFVNTQPRPVKDISKDWPDNTKKPFDYPFGPYADGLSEAQHKYGPWGDSLKKLKGLK